jgi:hypothetical protein
MHHDLFHIQGAYWVSELSIEEGFWWQVLVVPARGCCLLHPLTAQFSHCKTGIDPSVLDQILNLHSPCDEIAPPASMGTTTTTSSNFSTKSSLVLKLFHPKKRLSQQPCHPQTYTSSLCRKMKQKRLFFTTLVQGWLHISLIKASPKHQK